jgi:hypothetical protein
LIDPSTAVKPASPAVANVAVDASATQSLAPQRPEFSLADQGKYRLVEYVADGNGPLILKTADMERYGLARQVVRNDAELLAFFGAKNLRRLDPTWSEGLVAFLTNPIVRGVLIVIFLIALFLEMSHPGVTLPGLVAGVSLVALLAPPLIIGMANWWEVAAIASGILLIALEIFVIPGFGITGILGVLLLFAGLIGTFVPSGSDSLFPDSPQGRSEVALRRRHRRAGGRDLDGRLLLPRQALRLAPGHREAGAQEFPRERGGREPVRRHRAG